MNTTLTLSSCLSFDCSSLITLPHCVLFFCFGGLLAATPPAVYLHQPMSLCSHSSRSGVSGRVSVSEAPSGGNFWTERGETQWQWTYLLFCFTVCGSTERFSPHWLTDLKTPDVLTLHHLNQLTTRCTDWPVSWQTGGCWSYANSFPLRYSSSCLTVEKRTRMFYTRWRVPLNLYDVYKEEQRTQDGSLKNSSLKKEVYWDAGLFI